ISRRHRNERMQLRMNRRELFPAALGGAAYLLGAGGSGPAAAARKPIRVVVWDEEQQAQKQAYDNFLGNYIADHLRGITSGRQPDFTVRSVRLDDPQQGLGDEILDNADVL